uniref:Uncharacterized protein n=1 Tax=Setaria italica TaxID=4555 RepID=K4AH16_SETIT
MRDAPTPLPPSQAQGRVVTTVASGGRRREPRAQGGAGATRGRRSERRSVQGLQAAGDVSAVQLQAVGDSSAAQWPTALVRAVRHRNTQASTQAREDRPPWPPV